MNSAITLLPLISSCLLFLFREKKMFGSKTIVDSSTDPGGEKLLQGVFHQQKTTRKVTVRGLYCRKPLSVHQTVDTAEGLYSKQQEACKVNDDIRKFVFKIIAVHT